MNVKIPVRNFLEYFKQSAEKYSDLELLADFYVGFPHEQQSVLGRDTVYIEGERGTGKSTLLHMSLLESKAYTEKNPDSPWICTIIDLQNERFTDLELIKDYSNEHIKNALALEYANLFLLRKMLSCIYTEVEKRKHGTDIRLEEERLFALIGDANLIQEPTFREVQKGINYLFDERRDLFLNQEFNRIIPKYDRPSFLLDFFKAVTCIPAIDDFNLSKSVFTFLIDEYDLLDYFSQKVFNTLFISRFSRLNFKVAYRPRGITHKTLNRPRSLELHDISFFNTNPYSQPLPVTQQFYGFYKEIANKRLQKTYPNLKIEKILGSSISPSKLAKSIREVDPGIFELEGEEEREEIDDVLKEKIRAGKIQFWGLYDVVALSSGITRYFIEMISRIISRVKYIDETKLPVSIKIQSQAIEDFSQYIFKNSINDAPNYKKEIQLLIQMLSGYFNERLMKTKLELNATMAFRITDSQDLLKEVEDILDEAVKRSILQVSPLRKSKDGRYNEPVYHLNRIFAPVMNLLPLARDTLTIPSKKLNSLIDDVRDLQEYLRSTIDRQISNSKKRFEKKKQKTIEKEKKGRKRKYQQSLDSYFNSSEKS